MSMTIYAPMYVL